MYESSEFVHFIYIYILNVQYSMYILFYQLFNVEKILARKSLCK